MWRTENDKKLESGRKEREIKCVGRENLIDLNARKANEPQKKYNRKRNYHKLNIWSVCVNLKVTQT